ncbi:O-antigen ligase family protein [Clostridium sp. 19966]|uniref:O-antigen ligase family protein n=1 Tax=Clostridium sp. 19966 TaxID=2768166 RepID=UPI0028E066CC|nr:O-antigen ligase family protein [Clostridium sp. 19966]MDT8716135.1 O-antigen ligase family protein [Clostridium sp. 19966]
MKKTLYVLIAFFILMPYVIFGEEFASCIILLCSSVYYTILSKGHKVNKAVFISLLLIVAFAIFSLAFSYNYILSLGGLTIYLNAFIFYLIFSQNRDYKEDILKFIIHSLAAFALIFAVYQGIIFNKRIYGNVGYANSYGFLLFIALVFTRLVKLNENYKMAVQTSLIFAIAYTGSRNTIFYVFVFILSFSIKAFKEKQLLSELLSGVLGGMFYMLCYKFGFGMFLLLPPVIYMAYILFNNKNTEIKNICIIFLTFIGILAFFTVSTNLLKRASNTSINSGVLQERFVYYEDAVKHIIKNPFGSGINTFEYKEYKEQSAFYDVRFIHNSLLQSAYDLGLQGMIAFLAFAAAGWYTILRKKDKNYSLVLCLYSAIYLHSLLDFDFSYAFSFIILAMLSAFYGEGKFEIKFGVEIRYVLAAPVLLLSLYLSFVGFNNFLGSKAVEGGDLALSKKVFEINNKISLKNPDIDTNLANIYNIKYGKEKNKEYLDICLSYLKEAEKKNPLDPRIKGNIAFVYEKLNNSKKAIEYYDKFIEIEPYYLDMYKKYYAYLNIQYAKTHDKEYADKLDQLVIYYNKSIKSLNPKAKYMNDQIGKPLTN